MVIQYYWRACHLAEENKILLREKYYPKVKNYI